MTDRTTNQFQAEYGYSNLPVVIAKYKVEDQSIEVFINSEKEIDTEIKLIREQDNDLCIILKDKCLILTNLEDKILGNYKDFSYKITLT